MITVSVTFLPHINTPLMTGIQYLERREHVLADGVKSISLTCLFCHFPPRTNANEKGTSATSSPEGRDLENNRKGEPSLGIEHMIFRHRIIQ